MDSSIRTILWQQFGAAIDMLENAIRACPAELWGRRSLVPEYWYTAYHTLFWLDYYLSESPATFAPPPPFNLDEMDPAGLLPDRVYTQAELLNYLAYGRGKCRARIASLTEETVQHRFRAGRKDFNVVEILLYNMRHVQHHAGQLNLLLRQNIDDAPRWVSQAGA
ncbi:DinB family protein [candidate division KSB1 bacterium]|nr:DinB family protein [candidate division KSB1 bacterium]